MNSLKSHWISVVFLLRIDMIKYVNSLRTNNR